MADGRTLPYPDRSFDVAHTSLVLHHLAPDAAVALLREMGRVARLGVVVNDLDRSRLGWIGAWLLGHLLTANRYSRIDGPLSVRRAYRAEEMAATPRRGRPRPFGRSGARSASGTRSPPSRSPKATIRARRPTHRASAYELRAPGRGVERVAGVVVVGGGPAGAVLAARLAGRGRQVVVLERSPGWRWRASGVFTSPAAVAAFRRSVSPAPRSPPSPADPGDARRDRLGDGLPADVRRRCGRRVRRRVRSVPARPGAPRLGNRERRRDPAWLARDRGGPRRGGR